MTDNDAIKIIFTNAVLIDDLRKAFNYLYRKYDIYNKNCPKNVKIAIQKAHKRLIAIAK